MSKIEILEQGNYDKAEFYSKMGAFFAERKYRRDMPYLVNDDNMTWFIITDNGEIVAFGAISFKSEKEVSLENGYTVSEERSKGYWKQVIDARMKYLKESGFTGTIKTIVKLENQVSYLEEKYGFEETRHTTNYHYMETTI